MAVRAKFKVHSITNLNTSLPTDVAKEVTLYAVYGEGNEDWSKYTPFGQLKLTITNPNAIAEFSINQEFYIDITPTKS